MLAKIEGYAPSLLPVKELYTLCLRLQAVITAAFSNDAYISGHLAKIAAAMKVIEESLSNSIKSAFTEILQIKDALRDKIYREIFQYLKGEAGMEERPLTCGPAKRVVAVFYKHGRNLDRLGYAQETAALKSLLVELSEQSIVADLATLNLTNIVARLAAAQNDFETTYLEKVNQEAHVAYTLMSQARLQANYSLDKCVEYIDGVINDDPVQYATLRDDINMIIADVTSPARAQRTRLENEKKEQDADVPPQNVATVQQPGP